MFPTLYREMALHDRMTAKDLAQILGVTPKTMYAKLAGKTPFKLPEMRIIQSLFDNLPIDVLFASSTNAVSKHPTI